MRWLPRFARFPWTGCDDLGEFEGVEICATWGRFTIGLTFGRHNRRLS